MTLTLSPDELALIPKPPPNLGPFAEHMWVLLRASLNVTDADSQVMLRVLTREILRQIDRSAGGE